MASLKLVETMETDKQKALTAALSQIDRAFGKGSVMRLGEKPVVAIEAISTGSLGLDIALGIGGLPKGRIVEIYGPESSGKTTLALHVIAEAQKSGGVCAFVDAEHALDPIYARKLGVDLDDLLVSQPDSGEQALEITDTLVRSGAVDVLVVDSVAALTPKAELEGEMGDTLPGLQARLMSQALRKLTGSISKSNTLVIFMRIWLMKITSVLDFEIEPVSLRSAWLIRRACRPGSESPISPSSSAFGVNAATESITSTSTAPERTSVSVISSACSPLSGCETRRSSRSTPSLRA